MNSDPNPKGVGQLFVGALLGSILAYAVLVAFLVGVCQPMADSTPSQTLPLGAPTK